MSTYLYIFAIFGAAFAPILGLFSYKHDTIFESRSQNIDNSRFCIGNVPGSFEFWAHDGNIRLVSYCLDKYSPPKQKCKDYSTGDSDIEKLRNWIIAQEYKGCLGSQDEDRLGNKGGRCVEYWTSAGNDHQGGTGHGFLIKMKVMMSKFKRMRRWLDGLCQCTRCVREEAEQKQGGQSERRDSKVEWDTSEEVVFPEDLLRN